MLVFFIAQVWWGRMGRKYAQGITALHLSLAPLCAISLRPEEQRDDEHHRSRLLQIQEEHGIGESWLQQVLQQYLSALLRM